MNLITTTKVRNSIIYLYFSVLAYLVNHPSIQRFHYVSCIDQHQPENPLPDPDDPDGHNQRLRHLVHDHHNIYSRYLNLFEHEEDEVTKNPAKTNNDNPIYESEHNDDVERSEFEEGGLIHFQISEPENLRYTFKAKTSRIGVPFNETIENIALVLAEPRAACTSIINRLEIKDNIALVERGFCPFLEKCIAIERSGGIGVLVYDNDKNNSEDHIEMIDDSTPRNCSIPAVYVLGKDGHMIVQSLLALRLSSAVMTIPIKISNTRNSAGPPWSVL